MRLRPPVPHSLRSSLIRLDLRSYRSSRPLRVRAVLLVGALLACSVASPETEVREALARTRRLELAGDAGTRIALEKVRFGDVAVSMDGDRALVIAVVEADGRVGPEGGPALVYVGREAFEMERCPRSRWCAAGRSLPALLGVVEVLARAPREPRAHVVAWQVRVERGEATAGEDYELGGRRLRARWEVEREGDGWRIRGGP